MTLFILSLLATAPFVLRATWVRSASPWVTAVRRELTDPASAPGPVAFNMAEGAPVHHKPLSKL